MSYILDALKKAERDRRRAHVPSVGTMHAAPPERRLIWPWIAGGLVAINALGFAIVFAFRTPTPPAPIVSAPAPVTAPVAAVPPAVPITPAAAPPVAPSAPVAPAPPAKPTTSAPSPVATRAVAPRAVAPSTHSAPAPAEKTAAPPPVRPAEPEALKLEVLVYSDNVAERSAWISGLRYVEGQRLGRLVVERIMRDGVVLAGDGKRVVLKQE